MIRLSGPTAPDSLADLSNLICHGRQMYVVVKYICYNSIHHS